MRIVALKYGESVFGEENIFKGGRKGKHLPISFVIYLIQTEGRNILVDAGCDDGAGFAMSVFERPVDVLRQYGLSPQDITDVIITHSHHDHVQAVRYYENAIIHIQRDEYPGAKPYIPAGFPVHLIDDEFAVTKKVTVQKIGGHSVGSCIVLADSCVLCTGVSCNEEASRSFIETFSQGRYTPLLFHDPGILPGRTGHLCIV